MVILNKSYLLLIFFFLFIQNNCYILIIPGFGIVSHIVSTFSGKPVFGYIGMVNLGPLIYIKRNFTVFLRIFLNSLITVLFIVKTLKNKI